MAVHRLKLLRELAGRMLAQTATDVAIALERADAVRKEFTLSPRGEVTLTTFPTGGQMLLPGLLDVVAEIPDLTLIASDQDPLHPDFTDLTPYFDVVIADAPGLMPSWRERGLAVVKLMDEPLDIAMPEGHPLANKASLSAKDLVDVTWIGVPLGFPYDRILRQVEAITGVPATAGQRFGQRSLDNGIVEALVATGHGLAILPRFTTRDQENGLVTRALSDIRSTLQISALMRPDRAERPSVRLVLRALRDVASGVAAQHPA